MALCFSLFSKHYASAYTWSAEQHAQFAADDKRGAATDTAGGTAQCHYALSFAAIILVFYFR
jgi:hypothetical protein